MTSDVVCVYHANCDDGVAAAWVFGQACKNVDIEPTYYPGVHGELPDPNDFKGKHVFFVDFAYKKDILLKIAEVASSMLIMDHHVSFKEELDDLSDTFKPLSSEYIMGEGASLIPQVMRDRLFATIFDLNQSGAGLVWRTLFPRKAPPMLILHIEDSDLFRFTLPDTQDIIAGFRSHPLTFDTIDAYTEDENVITLKETGKIIRKYEDQKIEDHIAFGYTYVLLPDDTDSPSSDVLVLNQDNDIVEWTPVNSPTARPFIMESKEDLENRYKPSVQAGTSSTITVYAYNKKHTHIVPVINAPKAWGTKIAKKLADMTDSPFALYYTDMGEKRSFGMRVATKWEGHIDLSKIAQKFGGGGHPGAAGFEMPAPK